MTSASNDISIQDQIDTIKIVGMGVADWVQRARAAQINRPIEEIERKQRQLEVLREILRTLEVIKAARGA